MDRTTFPDRLIPAFEKALDLSYGENPHQRAAYYAEIGARRHLLSQVEQLHGRELSFNNLNDLNAARLCLREFELPACVIVKHANPCGVSVAGSIEHAYERALPAHPVSAYGGVAPADSALSAAPPARRPPRPAPAPRPGSRLRRRRRPEPARLRGARRPGRRAVRAGAVRARLRGRCLRDAGPKAGDAHCCRPGAAAR